MPTDPTRVASVPPDDALADDGLSLCARTYLPDDVQQRVSEAWARGRAVILNAHRLVPLCEPRAQ